MNKVLGAGLTLLVLSCGTAPAGDGIQQTAVSALSGGPNLTTMPGRLCSTRGFDGGAPTLAMGLATFGYPQSRGVIGGTGVGDSGTVAQSRIDFTPTTLSNSIVHGRRSSQ